MIGRLGAVSEKYLLEIEALLTVRETVPVFEAAAVMVLLWPAVTMPKSRLAPLKAKVPSGCCCAADLPELNPWQPTRKVRPTTRSNAPITFLICFEQIAVAGVFRIVIHRPVPRLYECLCPGGGRTLSLEFREELR